MYGGFRYETIDLSDISLDQRNPRIVMQAPLRSQQEILAYLFEHAALETFIKKIASEGKNIGAERPYIVEDKKGTYTVIEGNTRIAAYKVLTGLLGVPKEYASAIPSVSTRLKTALLKVDCAIAPDRDALLSIMASAHFGQGDKTKWGYLGSRKAVYDEWQSGKTIPALAKAFDRTQTQIRELIFEYLLYLEALTLTWTKDQKAVLLSPAVEFNPPIRFLQSSGHKKSVGISFDVPHMKLVFAGAEAKKKYKHMLHKLVINPQRGLGATASYNEVFADFGSKGAAAATSSSGGTSAGVSSSGLGAKPRKAKKASNSHALFSYVATVNNGLIDRLMKESAEINAQKFPAAATFLLRNIVEAILRHIIDQQKANPASKKLDLEGALNLCQSKSVTMAANDKSVLKLFHKSWLDYLNLGAHGITIPNYTAVRAAADCIDQFIKRNV